MEKIRKFIRKKKENEKNILTNYPGREMFN